jgi:hypothetical protein
VISLVAGVKLVGRTAYSGVGFPNVERKSPLTWFLGERYSFSKSSGEMLREST